MYGELTAFCGQINALILYPPPPPHPPTHTRLSVLLVLFCACACLSNLNIYFEWVKATGRGNVGGLPKCRSFRA